MGIINSYERKAYKRLKEELLLKKVKERDERSKKYNTFGEFNHQVYYYVNPITQDEEIELRDLAKKEAKENMYLCMFI
jgi:hypothetical protein